MVDPRHTPARLKERLAASRAALLAELYQLGVRQTILVPVFLGQGGHVLRELPVLIAEAQLKHPDLQIRLVDAVGECDTVLSAIADYCLSQCGSVSNPVA